MSELYRLDADKTFLVSQKALIVEDGRLLVVKNTFARWQLPGGLVEMDEPLADALHREVLEETGLRIAIERVVAAGDYWQYGFHFRDGRTLDARFVVIAYVCRMVGGTLTLSEEHSDSLWERPAALLDRADVYPDTRFAVEALLRQTA